MTPAAWILMLIVWTVVTGVAGWLFLRVVRGPKE